MLTLTSSIHFACGGIVCCRVKCKVCCRLTCKDITRQAPPAVPGEGAGGLEGDERVPQVARLHQLRHQHYALVLQGFRIWGFKRSGFRVYFKELSPRSLGVTRQDPMTSL